MSETDPFLSLFKIASLGVVAENKERGTWDVEISLREKFQLVNGELTAFAEEDTTQGADSAGNVYADKSLSTATVKATWLPVGEANRITAPDVRRGEMVIVFTYADTDKYFWTPFGKDIVTRKLETAVWIFNATPDENDNTIAPDNCYQVKVSSHEKRIRLVTTLKNGEKCLYDIDLNMENGTLTIKDNRKNRWQIKSLVPAIEFENGNGVFLGLIKKDLTVRVPGNHTETTTGNLTITVEGDAKIKARTATISSSQNTINGKTVINGDTDINGNLLVNGNMESTGTSKAGQPMYAPDFIKG